MSKLFSRQALLASVITALVVVLAMAGISSADSNQQAAAAKKSAFTKAQTKALNKAIAKALKKKVGPVGPAGPAGPAVAPAAYYATNSSSIALPSNVSTNTTVATKALPAGKYAVSVDVHAFGVFDNATDTAQMTCRALDGATQVDSAGSNAHADVFLLVAAGLNLNVPLNFVIDDAAATTLTVSCSAGYDSPGAQAGMSVGTSQARMTAIAVSSIG